MPLPNVSYAAFLPRKCTNWSTCLRAPKSGGHHNPPHTIVVGAKVLRQVTQPVRSNFFCMRWGTIPQFIQLSHASIRHDAHTWHAARGGAQRLSRAHAPRVKRRLQGRRGPRDVLALRR